MKKTILFLSLMGLLSLTSCKKEQDKKSEGEVVKKDIPFTVEINVDSKKKDAFCLLYRDNSLGYFTEDNTIYLDMWAKGESETLVFELPKNFLPSDLRFDLTCDDVGNEIKINYITLMYKDKKFTIENKDLENYLQPNEQVVFNKETRIYSFDKKGAQVYDPSLTTNTNFSSILVDFVGYNAVVGKK